MAALANAPSDDVCTTLVLLDVDKYSKASPEMKAAALALNSVAKGGCKCGNLSPKQRFAACGEHLSCEVCSADYYKCANKRGVCTFPGCKTSICWPAIPLKAYDQKQKEVAEAIRLVDHALQCEEQKDTQGAHLRDVAMGREPADEAADPADPANPVEAAAQRGAKKRRKRGDYTEEEWDEKQEKKEAAAERKRDREETARKAAKYDDLLAENQELRAKLAEYQLADQCDECSDASEAGSFDSDSEDDEPLSEQWTRMARAR